ncbi:hypothetical protein BDZ97DRAFT_1916732 [Flammula alnicola]|nr:hypothetical protein BDZ97DRAFT_1916732 [Flammula alnicola]
MASSAIPRPPTNNDPLPLPLPLLRLLTLTASLSLFTLLPSANAYTWAFQNTPQQCGNLTVSISNSGGGPGSPPYRILIIPFGPSPLANNIEARKIMDIPFMGMTSRCSSSSSIRRIAATYTVFNDRYTFCPANNMTSDSYAIGLSLSSSTRTGTTAHHTHNHTDSPTLRHHIIYNIVSLSHACVPSLPFLPPTFVVEPLHTPPSNLHRASISTCPHPSAPPSLRVDRSITPHALESPLEESTPSSAMTSPTLRPDDGRWVSDATGFGSGGTSVAAQVTSSSDASCFNASASVSPLFVFSIEPPNQIVQCTDTRIWWDNSTVQGIPNFLGIIPGGQSFAIPETSITNVASQGTGFTWKPSLRGGTTLILVGGDSRGNGTAGSSLNVVSSGISNDGSCLSNSSPSSTPGSPAGGSYPTGTSGASTGSGGSSASVGGIVGGVLGGLAFLIAAILLFWFFRRRQRTQKRLKERPMDLLNAEDDDDESPPAAGSATRRNELPQYYQPEPFMVPDPTLEGSSVAGTNTGTDDVEGRRPMSGATSSFYTRATTPDTSYGYGAGLASPAGGSSAGGAGGERRKGGAPRPMRAVNIIQHDDAGPSPALPKEEEPETIELPPAYTAVGRPMGVRVRMLVRVRVLHYTPPRPHCLLTIASGILATISHHHPHTHTVIAHH